MPVVHEGSSLNIDTTSNRTCFENGEADIHCIASLSYRRRISEAKEQKYLYSFNKPQEYRDALNRQVQRSVFEDSVQHQATPRYVFEELDDIAYSPEHLLITKGFLSGNKREQMSGLPVKTLQVTVQREPEPLPKNRSFYRPNSTHDYLTKTLTLNSRHDGFNPKHGTPTRAQLLRNRLKFSSAPDLTYAYMTQKRKDGKAEALHQKHKVDQACYNLKSTKIEMDRLANGYRKFLIGSHYNTAKWIDCHTDMVNGELDKKQRPATSFLGQRSKHNSIAKRRAFSAVGTPAHLHSKKDSPSLTAHDIAGMSRPSTPEVTVPDEQKQTLAKPRKKGEEKTPDTAVSHANTSRSPNLKPYTSSKNKPRANNLLQRALVITPVKERQHSLLSEQADDIQETLLSQSVRRPATSHSRLSSARSGRVHAASPQHEPHEQSAKEDETRTLFVTETGADGNVPLQPKMAESHETLERRLPKIEVTNELLNVQQLTREVTEPASREVSIKLNLLQLGNEAEETISQTVDTLDEISLDNLEIRLPDEPEANSTPVATEVVTNGPESMEPAGKGSGDIQIAERIDTTDIIDSSGHYGFSDSAMTTVNNRTEELLPHDDMRTESLEDITETSDPRLHPL